jgi:transcriptional regulator with XRE-family HTH domain
MTTSSTPVDGPDLNQEVGALIHQLMFRRRVTQTQLAAELGIGQSTISAKLHGKVGVSIEDLYTIARVLDVDPGDLLPRLDSNQQPSGYRFPQVMARVLCGEPRPVPASEDVLVDLGAWRERRAVSSGRSDFSATG